MIKKFVSNALLSVLMDKDARKKLKSRQKMAHSGQASSKDVSKNLARKGAVTDLANGEDVVDTIAQALAEARAEVAKGPSVPSRTPPPTPRSTQAAPKPSPQPTSARKEPTATPERQRLIQEAMAIHRQKSHVLDELDPDMREKLMVMAMYAMDPTSLPPEVRQKAKADAEADGLVDELGAKAGSRRKKPIPPRK